MSTLPTVPEVIPRGTTSPIPRGASAPLSSRTPTPRPSQSSPHQPETPGNDEHDAEALAPTAPTPPAPRPLPAFLKLGQPGGPSSTSEMNAAMAGAGPSRARSTTPQGSSEMQFGQGYAQYR